MRVRIIAVVAAFSMLFTAGIASASSDGTDSTDTRFTYGFDPQAQLLLTGIQDIESATLDCSLTGSLTPTYGDANEDGVVSVVELKGGGTEVTFGPSDPSDGAELAGEPIGYTAAIDECGISGIPVGTNGNINHGQIMKAFNAHIAMQGRGCLNRWLAGSTLGKDEQQVKGQDDAQTIVGEDLTIDFTTVLASCQHGKKDKGEDHPSNLHGKDKTSAASDDGHGRPESPGKSNQAPGKTKDK